MIGSKELIRNINKNLVIKTVIKNSSISRADLSKVLGLTKATISSIVQELINENFIIETGNRKTSIGRKPTMLVFNGNAGSSVGIEVSPKYIDIMVCDLLGKPIIYKSFDYANGYTNYVKEIKECLDSILPEIPETPYNIVGITLSFHGVVKDNKVIFAPAYNNVRPPENIAESLKEIYNVPVYVCNTANLSAVGENVFSVHKMNVVSIYIRPNVGMGIILGGKLYTGNNGIAGNFGHITVQSEGKPCVCGNKGCLECYASETSVLNEISMLKNTPNISYELFSSLYKHEDFDTCKAIDNFIKYISAGIINVINLFDPEVIVINSIFTETFPEIIDKIEATVRSNSHSSCEIKLSKFNKKSVLYGANFINTINFLQLPDFI